MPKSVRSMQVKRIAKLGDGLHYIGHVPGLCLQVKGSARSYILTYSFGGRARQMGPGSHREVDLADVIEAARDARKLVRSNVDPLAEKHALRQSLLADAKGIVTFKTARKLCVASMAAKWRSAKHEQQWTNTLETYAGPLLDNLDVRRITTPHVLAVLEPIWTTKTETATRLRQRIESVLDYAKANGSRTGDNPARWKGHLDKLLPEPKKVKKVEHLAAVPWREMPAFMPRLRAAEGMGARALEFATLTAAGSGPVRKATWMEIDFDTALWTVPADHMKGGKEHVVPLSPAALNLLRALPRFEGVSLLFPSPRSKTLSDMTLTRVLERMKVDATVHGMRSSFKDWASEATAYAREVSEMALAHSISNAVEEAYRRGDLLAKRTRLMRDWAAYLEGPKTSATVTPMRKRRAQ